MALTIEPAKTRPADGGWTALFTAEIAKAIGVPLVLTGGRAGVKPPGAFRIPALSPVVAQPPTNLVFSPARSPLTRFRSCIASGFGFDVRRIGSEEGAVLQQVVGVAARVSEDGPRISVRTKRPAGGRRLLPGRGFRIAMIAEYGPIVPDQKDFVNASLAVQSGHWVLSAHNPSCDSAGVLQERMCTQDGLWRRIVHQC